MPCPRASVRHSAAMNDGTLSCSPTTCRHSRPASTLALLRIQSPRSRIHPTASRSRFAKTTSRRAADRPEASARTRRARWRLVTRAPRLPPPRGAHGPACEASFGPRSRTMASSSQLYTRVTPPCRTASGGPAPPLCGGTDGALARRPKDAPARPPRPAHLPDARGLGANYNCMYMYIYM